MKAKIAFWSGRILTPFILLEWGAILTYFYCSHRLSAFLHPSFRPLVLVTGILLIVSAACVLVSDNHESASGCENDDCGHTYGKLSGGRLLFSLVLLVPIALAAKISPDGYGSIMIQNRGVAVSLENVRGLSNLSELSALSTPIQPQAKAAEVGDLLIAAQTAESRKEWTHRRVELTGQLYPTGENRFELTRMLILCCAADAQPLAVRVEFQEKPHLADLAWAKVVGTVDFTKKDATDIPFVTAETITPIPQPAEPYVYHGGSRTPVQHQGPFKFQLPPR